MTESAALPAREAPSAAASITPPRPPQSTTAPASASLLPTSLASSRWRSSGSEAPQTATYGEAFTWADAMREVIDEGRMPPWGANPRHGAFANDPSLTPAGMRIGRSGGRDRPGMPRRYNAAGRTASRGLFWDKFSLS